MNKAKIFLVSPEPIHRSALKDLLERDNHTVRLEAASAAEAKDMVHNCCLSAERVNLALVNDYLGEARWDEANPSAEGKTLARIIREVFPEIKIVALLTWFKEEEGFGDAAFMLLEPFDRLRRIIAAL